MLFGVTKDIVYLLHLCMYDSHLPTHTHTPSCIKGGAWKTALPSNTTLSLTHPSSLTNTTHVTLVKNLLWSPSERVDIFAPGWPCGWWCPPCDHALTLLCGARDFSWGCFILCQCWCLLRRIALASTFSSGLGAWFLWRCSFLFQAQQPFQSENTLFFGNQKSLKMIAKSLVFLQSFLGITKD